jgi:hypothetical protein
MRKSVRTPGELNELLLAELRHAPGCEGVAWVGVYVLRRHIRGRNWLAAFFNPGTADRQACARAMPAIEARLQMHYDASEPRVARRHTHKFLAYRDYHRRVPSRLLPDDGRRPQGVAAMFAKTGTLRKMLAPVTGNGRGKRQQKQKRQRLAAQSG